MPIVAIALINDVTSSQGVFNTEFEDVVPGSDKDKVTLKPDPDGFRVGNSNARRVEPRNTPSVINAVYNFRNFWDGRAQNLFNGVNPFGLRDPNAFLFKAKNPGQEPDRAIPADGSRTPVKKADNNLSTQEYTLMEYNFPLFFGLSVHLYEATLVSDDTPFDQFRGDSSRAANPNALTQQQKDGLNIFLNSGCIFCHSGLEFTTASVSNVKTNGRLTRSPVPGNPIEDTGFFDIGVTPALEDLGVGGEDGLKPTSRSLSEAVLAKQGQFQQVFGEAPNITVGANDTVSPDGLFKAPTLRNVELTASYAPGAGYSQGDCPAGTTFRSLPGGFVCE
jgi:cytochrome c peroxidase